MPVAESTFFDPPAGVALPPNDAGYTDSYKVIRTGQTVLLAVDPPPHSAAGGSVYELYRDQRGDRQFNKFFDFKNEMNAILWSHLEIVRRSRVKAGFTVSVRDDITNPFRWCSYTRVALKRQQTVSAMAVLEDLEKLFFNGAERATEKIGLAMVSGHPLGHVTTEGRLTILDCLANTETEINEFETLYRKIQSTDFITHLHGQPYVDYWNLHESTMQDPETSPFATWLAEEIGIFVHEKRCEIVEKLRFLIPEILQTHSIAGLFLKQDLRFSTSKEMAEEAKKILEAIGLLSASNVCQQGGDQLILLWTSPAVITTTKALLKLLGGRQMARCLQRNLGTTNLPYTVLALGSALIQAELLAIREIRLCDGFPMMETKVLGALTADDMGLYTQHRTRLLNIRATTPHLVDRISAAISTIEEAVDLDWHFVRAGVPR